ncbi:MAG: PQQ-like beta-propeller repeat protein [Candidatus Thermoplasmatota archaeon]|nr:PQQ-like beta-propeller repeat protein [Candidatus Thermoplasmatota archaeon]
MEHIGRKSIITLTMIVVIILPPVHAFSVPTRIDHPSWTSFRGNSMNQASSTVELGKLELEWEFEADEAITTSVVAADGRGIFATSKGTVFCVDVMDGSEIWNISFGSPVYSTPSIDMDEETVCICDSSGKVTFLEIRTGEIIWEWSTASGQDIRSSPLVADRIYFGSYDSYLYALNKNGTLAWRFEGCLGWVHTSPSYYEGLVFFGSCDGHMRALDAGTGEEAWNFSTAYIPSSPAVYDGKVLFGAYDSNFYCLNAHDGTLIWNTTMGDNVYSSPAVDGENIVVGCNDGLLYCLDIDDGLIIWKRDLGPSPLESSPLISGSKTAVNYDHGLVVMHISNGTLSERFLFGDAGETSPSVYDNMLFFGDEEGYVYCLQSSVSSSDDEDERDDLDMGEEVNVGRDSVFLIIATIMVVFTLVFIFLRRYRRIRKEE